MSGLNRAVRRILTALAAGSLAAVSVALPARAETSWRTFGAALGDPRGGYLAGAGACAFEDRVTGQFLCMQLSCRPNQGLAFGLGFSGGTAPDSIPATLLVDGRQVASFTLRRIGGTVDQYDYEAPYDFAAHSDVVTALKAGNKARMEFSGWSAPRVAEVSLAGSSKAISAAIDACPGQAGNIGVLGGNFSTTYHLGQIIGDPIGEATAEATRQCSNAGGRLSMTRNFSRREDLSGDGWPDVVIDRSQLQCAGAHDLYCTDKGCGMQIWLANPSGGFELVFDDVARAIRSRDVRLIEIDTAGQACGRDKDRDQCTLSFTAETGQFQSYGDHFE